MCRNKQLFFRYAIMLLAALWWPAGAMAETPPVVSSFTNYMHAGGSINPLSLTPHTTWTGDVATLTYTNLTDPAHGLLWPWDIAGQTTAYWSDNSGFVGTDSFQWCAVNGSLTSGVATCFISTTNCVPVASAKSWTGSRAAMFSTLATNGFYLPLSHADSGQTLSFIFTSPPTHGTLSPDPISGWAGKYHYTPNSDFMGGTDPFTWQVSDGVSTSATAVYTITMLNSMPSAGAQNLTVIQNTTSNRILLSYSDPTGAKTNMITLVTVPAHGTLANNGTLHAGSTLTNTATVYYTPQAGYTGVESFAWNDYNGITTSATVTATITVVLAGSMAATNEWALYGTVGNTQQNTGTLIISPDGHVVDASSPSWWKSDTLNFFESNLDSAPGLHNFQSNIPNLQCTFGGVNRLPRASG